MELRYAEIGGQLTIAFIGDLDNVATPVVTEELQPVFKRDDCDILIECTKLNYISSMGLRLLITLYKNIRDNGHDVYITHMNENVHEVLYSGGFLDLMKEV